MFIGYVSTTVAAVIGVISTVITILVYVWIMATVVTHVAENPEILGSLADAALVRCEIQDQLANVQGGWINDPDHKRTLSMLKLGMSLSAGDIRDFNGHLKNIGMTIAWDHICTVMTR